MTTTITRGTAARITEEIKAATAEILSNHGLAVPKCKTTYGDSSYKIVLETTLEVRGEGGVNLMSEEAVHYTRYGFPDKEGNELVAPLGTRFTSKGETYVFAGIAASRSKYPIVGVNVDTNETTFFTTVVIGRINSAGGEE